MAEDEGGSRAEAALDFDNFFGSETERVPSLGTASYARLETLKFISRRTELVSGRILQQPDKNIRGPLKPRFSKEIPHCRLAKGFVQRVLKEFRS